MKFTLLLPALLIGVMVVPRTITVTRVGSDSVQSPLDMSTSNGSDAGRRIVALVTGYSKAETCPDSQCITAGGKEAATGLIACPRGIRLGTKVEILGIEYTCMDRTAKKYDGRFDRWFDSREEALKWGIRKLEVTIHEK